MYKEGNGIEKIKKVLKLKDFDIKIILAKFNLLSKYKQNIYCMYETKVINIKGKELIKIIQ